MICNFLKWNVHLILNAPFQARTLLLFYKFGWLTINKITIERFLILFPKILDQRAPDYLSKKLLSTKYCKSQFDTRSPFALSFQFHVPTARSECSSLMLFNCRRLLVIMTLFIPCTDLKKFRRNYFEYIKHTITPDSFKTDRIFYFFINVILSFMWS